jgi:cation diffusion facilitator family transporter
LHIHTLDQWQHSHDFSVNREQAEKSTKIVMLLTAVTMVAEIVAGATYGSMALLADGWHMATHVAAFGIAVFAYGYARSHATDPKYTFGTGKVSILGGFASAVALAVIALVMALESIARLFQPHAIQFNEAIGVAMIGLVVNLVSAWPLMMTMTNITPIMTITIIMTITFGLLTFMWWQMRSLLFLRLLP